MSPKRIVALADDAARLTYSVDNGCTTGIGPGGVDETSTMVRVWAEPTFGNMIDNFNNLILGKIGSSYAFPSTPTVEMNNCTLVSQGWSIKFSNTFLDPAAAAIASDIDKQIVWQVRYTIPGDPTIHSVESPAVGKLAPWNEPRLVEVTEKTLYAKHGTKWSIPTNYSSMTYSTCLTIKSQTWVYGNADGTGITALPETADYASQSKKTLFRQIVFTLPGSSTEYTVNLPRCILYPWREPVMDNVTAVVWDHMCDTKSYTDNGRPLTRVNCNLYECTLKEENWKAGSKVIKTTDKPVLKDDDGATITYNMTWLTPDGKPGGTITRTIATLETYGVPSQLIVTATPAAAGSKNVQVIGVSLGSTYTITVTTPPTDRYGPCKVEYEGDRNLVAGDNGNTYTINAFGTNKCGSGNKTGMPMTVDLEANSRGQAYYAGVPEGVSALYNGQQAKLMRKAEKLYGVAVNRAKDIITQRGIGWKSAVITWDNASGWSSVANRAGASDGMSALETYVNGKNWVNVWMDSVGGFRGIRGTQMVADILGEVRDL